MQHLGTASKRYCICLGFHITVDTDGEETRLKAFTQQTTTVASQLDLARDVVLPGFGFHSAPVEFDEFDPADFGV